MIRIASALAGGSDHPPARAIRTHHLESRVAAGPAPDARTEPGGSLRGTVDGTPYRIGSPRQVGRRAAARGRIEDRVAALETGGYSVLVLCSGARVCGLIGLIDTPRPEAQAVLRALRRQGAGPLVMLTGDDEATASAVAAATGIEDVRAGLGPEEKVAAVEELVERFGTVAMVGYGTGDAPAMARASFGVALSERGSDAAIATADIALAGNDLGRLPWLVTHSRRALNVVRGNTALAIGAKLVFFVLTLAGLSGLWGAIAADMGATLLVVLNALRLLRVPPAGGADPGRASAAHVPADPGWLEA